MFNNQKFPRNNLLTLNSMKKRKIDPPIAFMINHLLNFRNFKVKEDLSIEEIEVNSHWEKLTNINTGEELMSWTKQLRVLIWGSDKEWSKVYPELLKEDKISITKKMINLLGSIVSNIISDNSYWINIWNEVKNTDYFNLDLQYLANRKYIENKFPFNPEIDESIVIERGEYIKDRFGIVDISFAGFFSYSDMFNILLRIEEELENFTSKLDWEESDFGAYKLSLNFGLSISAKSEYNSLNKVINLNISGLNNFYEEYFKAIDNEIALLINKNEESNIDEYATDIVQESYEEELIPLKNIIKDYINPKLKEYHKHNIKIKLLKMIPQLLETIITPKTSQEIFKAFVENRKNDYVKWFNKNMVFSNKTANILETWELWKKNTYSLVESELNDIMTENISVKLYLESIIRMVDNILQNKIKWNKSWIVLLTDIEKNLFEIKKELGIYNNSFVYQPKKSSIHKLLIKSFNTYLETIGEEELLFLNNSENNLSYPQGMDRDQENKWWSNNLNILKEYWIE